MECWITFNNKAEELRLPVLPSSFTITKNNINKTVATANMAGDVNLLGKGEGGLAEISIETFFPAHDYPFCTYTGFPAPYTCVSMIEGWRKSGQPIRLIMTETDINMAMGIETFEYGEKDGTGDVYYTLGLKEYRFLNVPTQSLAITPQGYQKPQAARPVTKSTPKSYSIQSGDSLWVIAKKLTGNGANYKAIAQKNGIKNPDKIYPGQKLVI
jgi:nucleoid-associated protein YgaU|uniref:Tail assembly protein n=1 Tax=Siphoviridae sp. ctOb14 TaxID=2827862 RepID=A0A8S5SMM5_9CAUD|nr:MAG TPA: tail assembly protein [Siphoviridae sp. ctOb14]